MAEISEYKIFVADSLDGLATGVQEFVRKGYKPIGGPGIEEHREPLHAKPPTSRITRTYFQALVK